MANQTKAPKKKVSKVRKRKNGIGSEKMHQRGTTASYTSLLSSPFLSLSWVSLDQSY